MLYGFSLNIHCLLLFFISGYIGSAWRICGYMKIFVLNLPAPASTKLKNLRPMSGAVTPPPPWLLWTNCQITLFPLFYLLGNFDRTFLWVPFRASQSFLLCKKSFPTFNHFHNLNHSLLDWTRVLGADALPTGRQNILPLGEWNSNRVSLLPSLKWAKKAA